jgi:Asp-tRNA(Asn)/Glu-tRNA(Gln) amidotransferase A subunit family amidase
LLEKCGYRRAAALATWLETARQLPHQTLGWFGSCGQQGKTPLTRSASKSGPTGDLTALTATEAAAALASGTITAEGLARACIARIEARDRHVEAWAHFEPERVIADARARDEQRRSGGELGALAGIPIGIKDIIDTAAYPTENGSPVFAGRRPQHDAFVVAQLKAAGAVIMGKTVTTELAFFGPGKTKNPRDPSRTPGGSSSGSAAAVADGQVPLALGTQTAGSIIRPASYCGVIGFKPTFGYISRTGILAQSAPLDTVGCYARCVEDIALLIDVLSEFDTSDGDMSPAAKTFLVHELAKPMTRAPRFAFVKSPAWENADADAKRAIETFAGSFGAQAEVVETPLPANFDGALRLQQIVQFSDIAKNYGPIADAHPDRVSSKLKEVVAEGRTFSPADIAAARAEADPLYQELLAILDNYDAILTPAAPGVALAGLSATGSPKSAACRWAFSSWARVVATAICCARPDG